MKEYERKESGSHAGLENLFLLARILASGVGLICIVAGAVCSVYLFIIVYQCLTSPHEFGVAVRAWSDAIGGSSLNFKIANQEYPTAQVLGTIVVGGGALMLSYIATGLMLTGSKIVNWMTVIQDIKKVIDSQTDNKTG